MIDKKRTRTEGGIPIFKGSDMKTIERSNVNFDGLPPLPNRLWMGPMEFELNGERWKVIDFLKFLGGQAGSKLSQN